MVVKSLNLFFIGNSERLRPFRKKYGRDYGLDYHFNAKVWMTATFLNAWLRRFDEYIRGTPGRKVALLLDNCSAHGTEETLPLLSQVEVIFLPPCTTSKI